MGDRVTALKLRKKDWQFAAANKFHFLALKLFSYTNQKPQMQNLVFYWLGWTYGNDVLQRGSVKNYQPLLCNIFQEAPQTSPVMSLYFLINGQM